ncbi:MAG TPA: hypothetical protein ACFYD6_10985 [Candidatus Brocadiia bacterium]|nr:hypothetical protein [Candidatus Brocadiales bacterium]
MNKNISKLFKKLEHFFFTVFFIHVAVHVVFYGVFGERHSFVESVLSFWGYVKSFYLPVALTILFFHFLFLKITPSQLYSYYRVNLKKAKEFYSSPVTFIKRELKISDFLEEIHQSRSDYSGALIDKIFVPPDEFNEIERELKNNKFVIITGTAGYGKTYTALRLLWERYNEGYIPRWVSGKEPRQREEGRDLLANIDVLLKPRHIIYFEDPFGKTKYERSDDLKGRINFIIDSVKSKEDVYVILTSRKDVFEEFEKESYSIEEIKKFEKELNIINPSYSYEKKKKILEKWAEEKECTWLRDEKLKDVVFQSLDDRERLPTPLSIHDFAIATEKIKEGRELEQKVKTYSKAVEKAFADEIIGLYESGRKDKALFLSFIFVSQYFEVDFVKQLYEKLKKENFEDFEKILKEEHRVKIGKLLLAENRTLEFSHPLYFNALAYILGHAGCKNIFCEVLKELSHHTAVVGYVSWSVVENFVKLPEDVRNLLFELAEKDEAGMAVAWAVARNFDKLPEDVMGKLLLKLSENAQAGWYVAWALVGNFNKLPENARGLLFKLAEKKEAAGGLALAIVNNLDMFSRDVGYNLLFKLSENDAAVGAITWAITKNFNRLPDDVRNKLSFKPSEKDVSAWTIAQAVVGNFYKLPEDVRNLLTKLAIKNGDAGAVAMATARNLDKIPEDVRNLLTKLAGEDKFAENVAMAVAENFGKLPEGLRNKLLIQLPG